MIDGLYLLRVNENTSNIIKFRPENTETNYKSSEFLCPTLSKKNDLIFSFTLGKNIAYSYIFQVSNQKYAIILLSHVFIPKLFLDFFEETMNYFNKSDQLEAECRFNVIWTLISSWYENNDSFIIYSFNEIRTVPRSILSFSNFKAYDYFKTGTDYNSIWKAVLLEKKILVTADNVEDIAPAIFSLIGLVEPFEFEGSFSILPNFEKSEKSSIVGCLSSSICNYDEYEIVLNVDKGQGNPKDTIIVNKKAKLLHDLMKEITDRNLEENPYHELVGRRIVTDDIDVILCKEMKKKTMTFDELRKFELTPTFETWNKKRMFRKELRGSFLSVSPNEAIRSLTKKEYREGYEKILELLRNNQNDEHFRSVLRKHRRTLEAKLGMSVIHSSDSSDTIF